VHCSDSDSPDATAGSNDQQVQQRGREGFTGGGSSRGKQLERGISRGKQAQQQLLEQVRERLRVVQQQQQQQPQPEEEQQQKEEKDEEEERRRGGSSSRGRRRRSPDRVREIRERKKQHKIYAKTYKGLVAMRKRFRRMTVEQYAGYDLGQLAEEYDSITSILMDPENEWILQERLRIVSTFLIRAMRRDIARASPTEVAMMHECLRERRERRRKGAGGGCSGGHDIARPSPTEVAMMHECLREQRERGRKGAGSGSSGGMQ